MPNAVTALALAVYAGIKPYLVQDHNPMEITMTIYQVVMDDYKAALKEAEQSEQQLPTPQSQSTETQTVTDANTGVVPVIASDDPVKDMPMKSVGRANLRMGRDSGGKSRP